MKIQTALLCTTAVCLLEAAIIIALANAPTPTPAQAIPLKPVSNSLPFTLTPAPPGETIVQRWQRTKADYERASALERNAEHDFQAQTTMLAIGPYVEAEEALKSAKCGTVCAPEKTP